MIVLTLCSESFTICYSSIWWMWLKDTSRHSSQNKMDQASCTNFILQATNMQSLETRLHLPYMFKYNLHVVVQGRNFVSNVLTHLKRDCLWMQHICTWNNVYPSIHLDHLSNVHSRDVDHCFMGLWKEMCFLNVRYSPKYMVVLGRSKQLSHISITSAFEHSASIKNWAHTCCVNMQYFIRPHI